MKAALFLAGCALFGASVQEGPATDIDRLITLAREGSAVVRPQAARRLVSHGKAAAEKLVEASEGGPKAIAKLGPALIAVMPDFDDRRLRERLWVAVDDRDFPWRPAAAMGLARTGLAQEAQRFFAFMDDPIGLVRLAGLAGIEVLDAKTRADLVRRALADTDDRVRRRAAVLLDRWGEHDALLWLVEEMRRDDRFFGSPTGRIARYEAAKLLRERLGEAFEGIDAGRKPNEPDAVAALAALEAKLLARLQGEPPELPRVARAFQAELDEVLGLEVRSCRRGEFYLRVDAADTLWVGTGHPVRVALPEGTSARLAKGFEQNLAELGEEVFWGEPGCDAEVFFWRPGGEGSARVFQVSKGPDAVKDLRPPGLGKVAKQIAEAIPDPELRAKVLDALAVTGGALP